MAFNRQPFTDVRMHFSLKLHTIIKEGEQVEIRYPKRSSLSEPPRSITDH